MDEIEELALHLTDRWARGFRTDTLTQLSEMEAWKSALIAGMMVATMHKQGNYPEAETTLFLEYIKERFYTCPTTS